MEYGIAFVECTRIGNRTKTRRSYKFFAVRLWLWSSLSIPRLISIACVLPVWLAVVLVVAPRNCFSQAIPEPALPRPGPPVERPRFPPEKIPEIEVQPLGEEAPPGATKIFTVLRSIEFEGVTVYSDDDLKRFYEELIGKKVSVDQVFAIAERIQAKYRSDGYILTRVIVPPQSVVEGIFKVRVVEGFVSGLKIEGDIGPVRARVQAVLEKLLDRRPVSEQDLERYLLLVNDLPGIRAVGFLRASTGEIGAAELVIQAERKPFEGYAFVNNRGSKFTGPNRFSLMIRENSGTFLGEQIEGLFFNTLFNDEQRFGQLAFRQHLTSEGLQLELSAGYGPSEPGFGLDDFDTETEALTVNALLNYPLIRSRKRNLFLDGGFQVIDEEVEILDTEISRDRLRVLFLHSSFDFSDKYGGQSLISLGFRKGLEAFGASEEGDSNLSRVKGDPNFSSINIQASRHQALWDRFGLYLAGIGQYALNTLLSAEEFRVGGERFGRGYNPAELAGDSGLAATAEFQYSVSGPFEFWQSLQGYGFYDFGVVWNRDPGTEDRASLASTGIGVRNRLLGRFFIDLEVAWPLTRDPDTYNKDPRLYLQVLTRF